MLVLGMKKCSLHRGNILPQSVGHGCPRQHCARLPVNVEGQRWQLRRCCGWSLLLSNVKLIRLQFYCRSWTAAPSAMHNISVICQCNQSSFSHPNKTVSGWVRALLRTITSHLIFTISDITTVRNNVWIIDVRLTILFGMRPSRAHHCTNHKLFFTMSST